jgi:hypothetical protein
MHLLAVLKRNIPENYAILKLCFRPSYKRGQFKRILTIYKIFVAATGSIGFSVNSPQPTVN